MSNQTGARLRQALARLWEDLRSSAPPGTGRPDGVLPRVTGYPIARRQP